MHASVRVRGKRTRGAPLPIRVLALPVQSRLWPHSLAGVGFALCIRPYPIAGITQKTSELCSLDPTMCAHELD
eukprot:5628615-Pleurochrysis_carterae.AAC.1